MSDRRRNIFFEPGSPVEVNEFRHSRISHLGRDLIVLPFDLNVKEVREDYDAISTTVMVTDRTDGHPLEIRFDHGIPGFTHAPSGMRAMYVREALIAMATHEIDEVLRWANGAHVRDPHR